MISIFQYLSKVDIQPGQIDIPMNEPSQASVSDILQIVFAVIGAISLLVIVIAGLMFVLSQGNPERTAKARNAIIYAIVGLIISLSAFTIVKFVVGVVG